MQAGQLSIDLWFVSPYILMFQELEQRLKTQPTAQSKEVRISVVAF